MQFKWPSDRELPAGADTRRCVRCTVHTASYLCRVAFVRSFGCNISRPSHSSPCALLSSWVNGSSLAADAASLRVDSISAKIPIPSHYPNFWISRFIWSAGHYDDYKRIFSSLRSQFAWLFFQTMWLRIEFLKMVSVHQMYARLRTSHIHFQLARTNNKSSKYGRNKPSLSVFCFGDSIAYWTRLIAHEIQTKRCALFGAFLSFATFYMVTIIMIA